jgi:superfamily II DNA helicase RecQ
MRDEGAEGREPVTDMWERVERITKKQYDHMENKTKASIEEVDENLEPNPWLTRVGWNRHLQKKDPGQLRAAVEPPDPTDEHELHVIIESFCRVVETAQCIAVREIVGVNALFEINRKCATKKPAMPFNSFMGEDTLKKYRGYWEQLICYIYRMQEEEEFKEVRPGYRLTRSQQDAFDALVEAADDMTDRNEAQQSQGREQSQNQPSQPHNGQEKDPALEKIDRLCLRLCIALLNHELGDDEYESVIISGMAVLGFRDDGGWLNAEDYTTKYSGVIKVARILVLYRSYMEREDGYETNRKVMDDIQARERTETMFDIVRRKVQKFMTLVSDKGRPTPMDWFYECRTYGMKIRYNTTAEGVLEWEGNRVMYQQIRFNMEQLRGMVHGLVEEARRDLMELLMLKMDAEGEVEAGKLPPIDWERLSDNASEEKIGWSFLKDVQNKFSVDGQWWLLKRISHEKPLQEEWFEAESDGHDHPYRLEAVLDYQRKVEAFQEKLLLIMHMVGGQPARATELIGIRYANTKQGGLRNIFIDRGMMAFVSTYHKGYRSSGKMKIIHRYLPREVGELLLRYLWLVLPFWQAVQSVVENADQLSPFVWSDAVQPKEEETNRQGSMDIDEGYESAEPDFKTMHRSKQWTSERLRKIMQKESEEWLGLKLNISAWRHIVIGIARRYLSGKFVADEAEEDIDWETFDEDNLEGDSPWDLQAGHGTHVAGMIYARELRQAPGQTMGRQDMFRKISQEWHRFLQFTSSIQGFGVKAGMKRPRSEWEHIGREVQFRRFKQMCHVNIHGKLKELMGPEAEFRGLQEKAIHAIMTGQSPIVNVMATGEGKSLSFMLPAYCVSGGTTVVIIPLCSLQEDLERRCTKAHIECVQWDSRRPHETASIVLVTPESAVTKTFSTYINRLRSTYQLDRVVMDESHVVLDSGPEFRPKLRTLGAEMIQMGTQLIFLTATLPPRDEEEFFHAMNIPKESVYMFRAATARPNIRYQVHEVGEQPIIEAICRLVKEKLEQYPAPGKIIVYGGSVDQTQDIGEALECPVYHRNVDDRAGKTRRMKELMEGKSRVISATNALGLGVDLPDVRLVIHAGKPRKLRDYAQESGRAGRDRQSSEAIIVCCSAENQMIGHNPRSWAKSEGEDIDDFMAGYNCRRVIMDRVMDGRIDRMECEDGEEQCDVCQRGNEEVGLPTLRVPAFGVTIAQEGQDSLPGLDQEDWQLVTPEAEFEDSGIGRYTSSQFPEPVITSCPVSQISEDQGFMQHSPIPGRFGSSPQDIEMQMTFEQQQRERQWLVSSNTKQCRSEGREVAEFEEQLKKWVNRCPLCHLHQRDEQRHRLEDCMHPELDTVLEGVKAMAQEIQVKKRFADFSCCYECGVPQAICQKWKQKKEQGWFDRDGSIRCQYPSVVIPVVAVIWRAWHSNETDIIYEWMRKDLVDVEIPEEIYKWFGQKVMWGGIETTKLCKIFHILTKLIDLE